MTISRRQTIGLLGGLTAAASTGRALAAANPDRPICYFTKGFQSLSFDELASLTAELGFDGVEATIRPGGHIQPEEVPDKLPQMVEAMRKQGKEVTIMASGINSATDPAQHAETVLRTAAELGIRHYRMAYLKYDLSQDLKPQLAEFKSQLTDLAALNQEIGIQALYQNHSGSNYVGAVVWDLCELMEDLPREAISFALDIRHTVVEAGTAWRINAKRALPLCGSIYVKDFVWGDSSKPVNVPLGEGRVDPKFFSEFQIADFSGPISLHVEYIGRNDPDAVAKGKAAYETDFATLKEYLGE